ncbi:hypothetical protein [Thermoanaerobacterium sp. RBIITD]|uniref:hypothetical protein n=1 Tax=Thermoanaerobacterium sp. RBIITD TaxID=1550240 RepID=UPI00155F5C79|nr:hypothetical protein [Thermoanaerobacterium sp. RBIITD]
MIISVRFIYNILMTLGLVPILGIIMPFRTQFVIDMMMLGIMTNIIKTRIEVGLIKA